MTETPEQYEPLAAEVVRRLTDEHVGWVRITFTDDAERAIRTAVRRATKAAGLAVHIRRLRSRPPLLTVELAITELSDETMHTSALLIGEAFREASGRHRELSPEDEALLAEHDRRQNWVDIDSTVWTTTT